MYKEYEIKAKCYKTEDCYLVAGGIKLSWRGRNLGKSTGEGGGVDLDTMQLSTQQYWISFNTAVHCSKIELHFLNKSLTGKFSWLHT